MLDIIYNITFIHYTARTIFLVTWGVMYGYFTRSWQPEVTDKRLMEPFEPSNVDKHIGRQDDYINWRSVVDILSTVTYDVA